MRPSFLSTARQNQCQPMCSVEPRAPIFYNMPTIRCTGGCGGQPLCRKPKRSTSRFFCPSATPLATGARCRDPSWRENSTSRKSMIHILRPRWLLTPAHYDLSSDAYCRGARTETERMAEGSAVSRQAAPRNDPEDDPPGLSQAATPDADLPSRTSLHAVVAPWEPSTT